MNEEKNRSPGKVDLERKTKVIKRKKRIEWLKTILLTFLGLIFSGLILFSFIIFNWIKDTPELDISKVQEISKSSIVYDINGEEVTSFSSSNNNLWASRDEIPQNLKNAFVAIEDKNFYKHKGVSYKRLAGAILGQLTGLADYGGSTITQQLVKNVYLTPELSYKRKAQEIYLTFQLEKALSKDEILEAYMNIIYMGGANYGVRSASLDYFGKELNDLNLKETALIAGLAQSPNGYNPKLNKEKGDMSPSIKRLENVLFAMREQEYISEAEYQEALNGELFVSEAPPKETGIYPHAHFIEYMINEVAVDLLRSEGEEISSSNLLAKKSQIRNGGYKIYSSMEKKAQVALEESLANYDKYPEVIGEGITEASAVVLNNDSYNIAAMAGSRKAPTVRESFNRAVHSSQPVGSIIKPLSIFAPAIESGLGSGSVDLDYRLPVAGYGNNAGDYPGGVTSNKIMTLRESLETSNNLSAGRFLYNNVSPSQAGEYLLRMGLDNRRIKTNGPSLVLGVSDTTVLEMAGAYGVFTNNGIYSNPKSYVEVRDSNDNIILSSNDFKFSRKVFQKSTAWIMTDIMRTEVVNGTGKLAQVPNMTTAGKTGTHEDRVVTYAGMTPYYTSVVKVSNDNYLPLKDAWGGTTAAGLFSSYMSKINEGLEDKAIQKISMEEAGVVKVRTSTLSGKLANDMVEELGYASDEYYKKGTEPKDECNMVVAVCKYQPDRLPSDSCWRNKHVIYKVYGGDGTILAGVPSELKNIAYPGLLTTMPTKEAYHAPKPVIERRSRNENRDDDSENRDDDNNNSASKETSSGGEDNRDDD